MYWKLAPVVALRSWRLVPHAYFQQGWVKKTLAFFAALGGWRCVDHLDLKGGREDGRYP